MKPRLILIAAIGVVLIAIVASTLIYSNLTRSYTFEKRFAKMPKDDIALQAWALGQPGVKSATITRIGDHITILYTVRGDNEPDPSSELAKLGYE